MIDSLQNNIRDTPDEPGSWAARIERPLVYQLELGGAALIVYFKDASNPSLHQVVYALATSVTYQRVWSKNLIQTGHGATQRGSRHG